MKLIKPSFEIVEQNPGIDGVYKQIEVAGRTCYKSENKITEDSAAEFFNRMVKSGHWAMLEHGTVYLKVTLERNDAFESLASEKAEQYIERTSEPEMVTFYKNNPYSVVREGVFKSKEVACITTNYRVLLENKRLSDFEFLCEPTKLHERRVTVRFIADAGVMREFYRHRVFSMAQESTRYCNYSKNRFNNECTFIIPSWIDIPEGTTYWYDGIGYRVGGNLQSEDFEEQLGYIKKGAEYNVFLSGLSNSERIYFSLLENGWLPQQARAVLPLSIKAEGIMTGTIEQWKGFFKLRCAPNAHPQARELAIPLEEEFKHRNYI